MNADRQLLKHQYRELFREVQAILFKHDPMGINFEHNTDEYDPEVGTILPRLKDAKSTNDVAQIIHEEFSRWFDSESAGDPSHSLYRAMAEDIWQALIKFSRPLP